MGKDFTQTRLFNSEEIKREVIHSHLMTVANALDERGYNAVHQIAGYLISPWLPNALIFYLKHLFHSSSNSPPPSA